jgi:hypothetical protein
VTASSAVGLKVSNEAVGGGYLAQAAQNHVDREPVNFPDPAGAAVLQPQHTVAAVDRFPGHPLHSELGRHPGQHQGVDVLEPEQTIQLGPG